MSSSSTTNESSAAAAAAAAAQFSQIPPNPNVYANATLYVGDLDPSVDERQLCEKFAASGPLELVRVCRDKVTRQSLGYAYVNYKNATDAERAYDTLNYELMNGRPMRIMWPNRDPSLRRSGLGNVFIKNLDKSIDNKTLFDTFSNYGNILSCKIMIDEKGESKGYGFVHFDTQDAADRAAKHVNGMLLANKQVYCGPFMSAQQRATNAGGSERAPVKFTNIYVKNFYDMFTDEAKFASFFAKYGEIESAKLLKGFGFVSFKHADDAAKCVAEVNGMQVGDKKLYAARFQKKAERVNELKRKHEERKLEMQRKFAGINLYVKNIDDTITEDKLRAEFEVFGTIKNVKIMTEQPSGLSKGFGFVCFNEPGEAARAVSELNGRMLGAKPLYVALAQRKEERRKILSTRFLERIQTQHQQNALQAAAMQAAAMPYQQHAHAHHAHQQQQQHQLQQQAYAAALAAGYPPQSAFISYPAQSAGGQAGSNIYWSPTVANAQYPLYQAAAMRSVPRWQNQQQMFQQQQAAGGGGGSGYQQRGSGGGGGFRGQQTAVMQRNNQTNLYGPNTRTQQQYHGGAPHHGGGAHHAGGGQYAYSKQGGGKAAQQAATQSIRVPGQEPLTASMLSSADPMTQKQMLGERLYPLIEQIYPTHAGKITGMLLEIDNAELLHMLEQPESLNHKVAEAIQVLQQAHLMQQQQQQTPAAGAAAPAGGSSSAAGGQ